MIIDSYAHVSSRKFQPVERLIEQMQAARVEAAVLVQPLGDFDNFYLEDCRQRYPNKFQTVAVLDENDSQLSVRIRDSIMNQGFAGIRATASTLVADEAISTLASVDGVLLTHLPDGIGAWVERLIWIAERFPQMRIFLPHLGWPSCRGRETPEWKEAVRALARYPQIAVAVSALYYFSNRPFPHKDTWEWITFALEHFGPGRCMWASDFPSLLEAETYPQYKSLFDKEHLELPLLAKNAVLGASAASYWRFASSGSR